ncbi:hypothetical protein SAMN02746041_02712 [Desulfacinum hydrothermale DSM 13146]|uniref:DUF2357 domain-containing protein n=1 Tax=Desulfacinum hydrothermale DSM 13146 TaxID=1121390 RepID=A0A1W1XS17_9BACT|nr:DUF2357 domain-containing protein [Desulfacinum hydrothermale]SMC26645.1 hypothetical protein SAMN02746041_02712 [Desulfacinum hydrothermale DSM 13146]
MGILYYSAQHRVALATDPLVLGQEPEEETLPDPVEVDERNCYFIRVFDPQAPMSRCLDQLPFVNATKIYPHGLRELSFLNRVGLTRIGPINIRVSSSKLSEDRYHSLLGYLSDRYANLVFSFQTPVGENYRREGIGKDIPYIEFLFLDRFLLGSPSRIGIIASLILCDPHRKLERIHVHRPPAEVAQMNPAAIEEMLLAPHRLARVGSHLAVSATKLAERFRARTGQSLFPSEIRSEEKRHTFDTCENRFLKFFLEQLARKVGMLRKFLATEQDGYLNPEIGKKIQILEQSLAMLLTAPLWRDVGTMVQVPVNSQVLQKKDGYRQLFRLYCLLHRMTICDFDAPDFRSILETKNIPLLYEYWCFFVLKDILDGLAPPLSADPIVVSNACEQKVVVGYRVAYPGGVVLHYNRTYGSPVESYSHEMRPDLVIHHNGRGMVFDAKFKVAEDGSFTPDDIDKMHAYRDSLKGIIGAFIFYPSRNTDPALFRAHHGTTDYEGVGAFPLIPDEQGCPSEKQIGPIAQAVAAFLASSGSPMGGD